MSNVIVNSAGATTSPFVNEVDWRDQIPETRPGEVVGVNPSTITFYVTIEFPS